jgi:hypothetical protein
LNKTLLHPEFNNLPSNCISYTTNIFVHIDMDVK